MSDVELARFLDSGEAYVEHLWHRCRESFGTGFSPARALDFGCGVGRVTLPLAKRTASVVAVDIAQSMLDEAHALLTKHGVSNVDLVRGDDTLSTIAGPFDLIHSSIVFQHIPVTRGLRLLERLIGLAGAGGTVIVHVLYHNPFRRAWPIRLAVRALRPLRPWRRPEIQMYPYPLNAVLRLMHRSGVQTFRVELTDHAGHLGAVLFFRVEPSH
jgi:SAM-dependent methyltransferase